MPDTQPQIPDDQFEEYLDGATPESTRAEIAARVRADEARVAEERLQEKINRALAQLFPPARAEETPADGLATTHPPRRRGAPVIARRVAVAAAAAVAAMAVGAALWNMLPGGARPTPYFERTPLAQLYQEAVRSGYEPYYECREPERFAQTFAKRQAIPLRLLPMPEGARMLGLSYPGGLSRNTTAMLCVVDDEPVMVFVDRAVEDERPSLAMRVNEGAGLNIFRTERDALVFYEVTPLDEPRVTDRMVVAGVGPSAK